MALTTSRCALVLSLALGSSSACENKDNGATSSSDGSTGSAGSSSTSSSSSTAATGPSGGSGSDGGSGSTTEGECQSGACCDPGPEVEAICAAARTQADCEATQVNPGFGACVWETWVPVTLEGETCTFGAPTQRCALEWCHSEGCWPRPVCGESENVVGALIVGPEGDVQVGIAEWCVGPPDGSWYCSWDPQTGEVLEGLAECDCLCDPAFPG